MPPMYGTDNPPPGSPSPTSTMDPHAPQTTNTLPVGNAPPIPAPGTAVEPGPTAPVPAFWQDPQHFVEAAARWIADDPKLQALTVQWIEALKARIQNR